MAIYTPKYDYRVKDSLPSGNTAKVIRGSELMEEFESISQQFVSNDSKGIVAACKYNGTETKYQYNITSISNGWNGDEGLLAGQYRVNFETPIDTFDEHYAPVVTPFPSFVQGGSYPVIVALQGFTASSVTFTVHQIGGPENGGAPTSAVGFSLLIVDMEPAG